MGLHGDEPVNRPKEGFALQDANCHMAKLAHKLLEVLEGDIIVHPYQSLDLSVDLLLLLFP